MAQYLEKYHWLSVVQTGRDSCPLLGEWSVTVITLLFLLPIQNTSNVTGNRREQIKHPVPECDNTCNPYAFNVYSRSAVIFTTRVEVEAQLRHSERAIFADVDEDNHYAPPVPAHLPSFGANPIAGGRRRVPRDACPPRARAKGRRGSRNKNKMIYSHRFTAAYRGVAANFQSADLGQITTTSTT
ncbi:hypothetical protein WA026_006561 [Henosepilachna vigintioctopunctata]|uniref:Uncharacterized protein n=1 Tax=Henosepilachna vigintioctopunctata TaxID=420089 RepID=A0AAW1U773_9CUCU